MKEIIYIYLGCMLNVCLHELTHYIMCILCKKKVKEIIIGKCVLFRVKKVKIGLIPVGGGVSFDFECLTRLERILIFFSAPIVSGIFVFLNLQWEYSGHMAVAVHSMIMFFLSLLGGEESDLQQAFFVKCEGDLEKGARARKE